MKILWVSNAPWASTGYGNQTALFAPRITHQLGYPVAIHAFYGLEGGVLNIDGIPVAPKATHPWGQDIAHKHAADFGAEVILSLMDAWVCEPQQMQQLGAKWVPWFPIDSEPMPLAVARRVQAAYRRVVFSRFAEQMVNDKGMDCYYVPHGVDTKVFKPGDGSAARKRRNLPQEVFIAGMVAANKGWPPRKAFFEQIAAFAQFHKKHSDSILVLHTHHGRDGIHQSVNLPEYCEHVGLDVGKDVYFPDAYQYWNGFPTDAMVDMYNAFDVLLNASYGEGFGIPILEAQACGCPVIVGDWTATGELCFAGWKIPKEDATPLWTPLAAHQYIPRVGAVVDRLELAYKRRNDPGMKKRARKGALAYDADKVIQQYWKPVLKDIEDSLQGRIEVERIEMVEAVA